ncbi:MAG: hypothetical protein E7626_05770 [Ruminococcaceae bacterium]|nr:hypothetical protein [Oscillospiraceae bacterium]
METIKGWYKNIGEKIKMLAIVMFLIEAFASIIAGIALMVSGIVAEDGGLVMFVAGFACMIVGPFVSYIGSWAAYAFGEIATNCKRTADNSEEAPEINYYSGSDLPEL